MKFTEEQFKQLVEIKEEQYQSDLFSVMTENENLYYFIVENNLEDEAVALLNPLTREWAHEQYVEKEKRYVWTSKEPLYEDFYRRLYITTIGNVSNVNLKRDELESTSKDEHLTETEVRNNGYDPDWFDKEEVE